MIVSLRSMTYDELKDQLSKDDKIVVWACNVCVKFCDVGGRDHMNALADKLEADGYNVIRRELIGMSCLQDLVRKRGTDEATAKMFEEATVIIPLTCEDGNENVKHVFKGKKVIDATKTIHQLPVREHGSGGIGGWHFTGGGRQEIGLSRWPLLTLPRSRIGIFPGMEGAGPSETFFHSIFSSGWRTRMRSFGEPNSVLHEMVSSYG